LLILKTDNYIVKEGKKGIGNPSSHMFVTNGMSLTKALLKLSNCGKWVVNSFFI
jgi:hypothetical protein